MKLSVVVPTYNRAEILRVCLRCLTEQTLSRDRFEVLVVDDGSDDHTRQVVTAFESDLHIRYLRQPENRGRAAARNRGIREAAGEVVVFVDSDVFPTPGFLRAHADVHARGERVVGRGPLILTDRADGRFARGRLMRDASPAFLDTANASVRRSHLLAAGGFDEGFRRYGWEDVDLGIRLRRLGLRRVFSARALAYHYQPAPSAAALPALLHKEEERAGTAVRFLRKHPGWASRMVVQLTPLHGAVVQVMTLGGVVNERTLPGILQRVGNRFLRHLLLRGVLNRHYLKVLRREWNRTATVRATQM
ncbi:MAG: glycosyltransferase [Armatimonadota bacterium]|nr:glycosyltransferase [Armatimonadota bacterium]